MKWFVMLAVGIALVLPGTALAQGSSTCQAYSPQSCIVSSNAGTTATTAPSTDSSLPFTGLNVGLLAVGGGVLLGSGLVMRMVTRRLD
jgi:hypothetical protein